MLPHLLRAREKDLLLSLDGLKQQFLHLPDLVVCVRADALQQLLISLAVVSLIWSDLKWKSRWLVGLLVAAFVWLRLFVFLLLFHVLFRDGGATVLISQLLQMIGFSFLLNLLLDSFHIR